MRLDEQRWIYGGGITPEWSWVVASRVRDALGKLKGVGAALSRAPRAVKDKRYFAGLRYFLKKNSSERDRLALHPAMDYWLFLWDQHFRLPCLERDWHLQMSLLQGLVATLALGHDDPIELDAIADPDARFYFYGSPWGLQFPAEFALEPLKIKIKRGRIMRVDGPGNLTTSAQLPRTGSLPAIDGNGIRWINSPELAQGLVIEDKAWLVVHGVMMHGLASFETRQRDSFTEVLRIALAQMAQRDPCLYEELTDMVSLIIPLTNPMNFGSVSSSYVNLRGAICLSHCDDPLLQAETLIHEFCHQKMNQLLVIEPILLEGQAGQVFYSPWRKDSRRLRGLLLGAHAFLNVARYLMRSISRQSYQSQEVSDVMLNTALRLYQVESALRTLSLYGDFTEFGRRFLLGMWQGLGDLFHASQWFPPALLEEARKSSLKHRDDFALFDTGFHKAADFTDKVKRVAFLSPGDLVVRAEEKIAP